MSLSLAPASAPAARAAGTDLTSRGTTTYVVDPSKHVVSVDVDETVTDVKPDTATTAFFFTGVTVYIQPSATRIRATADGDALGTTISHVSREVKVTVSFGRSVYHDQSFRFHLLFDLPGGAPRSASSVRVGAALVTFLAWSFPDTGGVRIELPPGYEQTVQGGPLEVTGDAVRGEVLTAEGIEASNDWYAIVTGERAAGLTTTPLNIPGAHLVIHGWPEDPVWSSRVRDRLSRGVPVLASLIGTPWPVPDDVAVTEKSPEVLEGYAGFYYNGRHAIEISEELDDLTILHEASHAWFNGALFEDRWIDEGLANEYATLALAQLGLDWAPFDTPNRGGPVAFPLADWAPPSPITDSRTDATEAYGYDASTHVMHLLVAAVGVDTMREVFTAAFERQIAYLGSPAPEEVSTKTSWQRFLDLIDERSATNAADNIFAAWVAPRDMSADLARRTGTRVRYRQLLDHGDGWLAPLAVRRPMADWDFATANAVIASADAVLGTRDTIDHESARLGVVAPAALESDYESATADLGPVQARADLELTTIEEISSASTAVHAATGGGDLTVQVGLFGAPDPELRSTRPRRLSPPTT